ncbi:uncharacterized protein [Hoplias malabaricus]|uniref:uncharacterized protein isoform X2 n=1 Tax=Hoplias malabaricus TaxID=27720 RepID=UPI003462BAAF
MEVFCNDIMGMPRPNSSNSCGVFVLMYTLYIVLGNEFDFSESDIAQIRKWWCGILVDNFTLKQSTTGQQKKRANTDVFLSPAKRHCKATSPASPMALDLAAPIIMPQTTAMEPVVRDLLIAMRDLPIVTQEPAILNDLPIAIQEPAIVWHLPIAIQWIDQNSALFQGQITGPRFLNMNEEDRMKALDEVMYGDDPEAKEPFLFIFEYRDDMELFLKACVDEQGLRVNAMFVVTPCPSPQNF